MSRPVSRRVLLRAGALLSVLALAACGGSNDSDQSGQSVDDVLSAVSGLSGKARTAKLVELAKAEGGGLTVYTSSSADYMADLAGAFEDEFDIEASVYKASSDALVQRMVEEERAGFRGSDVVESNTPGLINLDKQEILAPYASPAAGGLVDGAVGKSWIGDKFNTFLAVWNTSRVPKGTEPRSYEELAGPEWKGRLVLEVDDPDWYKTVWEHLVATGKTPAEADRIFAAIAGNASFVKGHTLMTQLVAAGEFDLSADSYLHTVEQLIDKGAPIAWQPAVEPLLSRADAIALVREAKHPAAAMLFMDFTLGPGQDVFADAGLTPARKDLGVSPSITQVSVDVPDYIEHEQEWRDRYEQVVRLGAKGPDN